jgi:RNA recognition motif-containing protein
VNADNKRKGEEGLDNPNAKTKKMETRKCSDLIVLGLPWKSTEDDLLGYFSQFGQLLLVQVEFALLLLLMQYCYTVVYFIGIVLLN